MPAFHLLPDVYALVQLPRGLETPAWAERAGDGAFVSISRTPTDRSIVCPESAVPPEQPRHSGWRCLVVRGPLDLGLVGVMASIAVPLADARVPIFPIATYETDYILVPATELARACAALRAAGHDVEGVGTAAGTAES
ncbi:MAG TPA: ACT domain-containing protein [Gemmatimonadaceae bacterium]|nr:ACT domain-containing protein [Gemmatimonadaceae bacterium]